MRNSSFVDLKYFMMLALHVSLHVSAPIKSNKTFSNFHHSKNLVYVIINYFILFRTLFLYCSIIIESSTRYVSTLIVIHDYLDKSNF